MKCAHCNKGFSCGCQKTKATNGQTVHKGCLSQYNTSIKNNVIINNDSLTSSINKAILNNNR